MNNQATEATIAALKRAYSAPWELLLVRYRKGRGEPQVYVELMFLPSKHQEKWPIEVIEEMGFPYGAMNTDDRNAPIVYSRHAQELVDAIGFKPKEVYISNRAWRLWYETGEITGQAPGGN